MPTTYDFDLLATRDEVTRLAAEWQALTSQAGAANPFLSFEWTTACLRHVCPDAQPYVLTARAGGALVGIAPLRRERELGFRVLRFIGDGRSDYQGFLCHAGEPAVEQALAAELERRRADWDLAILRMLSADFTGLHCAVPPRGLLHSGVRGTVSPYLPLDREWKRLVAEGPSSLRRGQRAARKLAKEGGQVERWTGRPAAERLEEAALVEERSWKEDRGVSRLAAGHRRELLREVLASPGLGETMELWLARLHGKPIAFLLNFVVAGEVWYYQGAYDSDHRKLYPGGALHYHCVERAVQSGCTRYDLLSGDEPYKAGWTTAERELRYLALYPPTLRGRLAHAALVGLRWKLKDLPAARTVHQTLVRARSGAAQLLRKQPA